MFVAELLLYLIKVKYECRRYLNQFRSSSISNREAMQRKETMKYYIWLPSEFDAHVVKPLLESTSLGASIYGLWWLTSDIILWNIFWCTWKAIIEYLIESLEAVYNQTQFILIWNTHVNKLRTWVAIGFLVLLSCLDSHWLLWRRKGAHEQKNKLCTCCTTKVSP